MQFYLLCSINKHFSTRAAKHLGIFNLTEKHVKNLKGLLFLTTFYSVVALSISINLAFDTNKIRLLIKESLFIRHD